MATVVGLGLRVLSRLSLQMASWMNWHASSICSMLLKPCLNKVFSADLFHPLPAAKGQNVRTTSTEDCLPYFKPAVSLQFSFPSPGGQIPV